MRNWRKTVAYNLPRTVFRLVLSKNALRRKKKKKKKKSLPSRCAVGVKLPTYSSENK